MIIIGALFAVSVMVGSVLAQWAAVAVVGMFLMGLGAALLATRKELGYAVLTICLPLAATGLTYDGLDESVGVTALFIIGSGSRSWRPCASPSTPPRHQRSRRS